MVIPSCPLRFVCGSEMTLKTYYHILNVSPRASDEDVRRAWRRLALRWHPDRNPRNRVQAQANFILINRAYTMLKTRPQREAYNRHLLRKKHVPHPPSRCSGALSLKGEGGTAKPARVREFCSAFREILWPFAMNGEARHG
jgi:DnaJ family protein B protein 4